MYVHLQIEAKFLTNFSKDPWKLFNNVCTHVYICMYVFIYACTFI